MLRDNMSPALRGQKPDLAARPFNWKYTKKASTTCSNASQPTTSDTHPPSHDNPEELAGSGTE